MIPAGQELGAYRVLSRLGAGGMGEVYLAEDIRLRRRVALKVLPGRSVNDEQARRQLLHEARTAAALDHPNICTIYEVGETDGRDFIAMQYVDGETLAERLAHRPLDLDTALAIAAQTAAALTEAHAHGVVHGDIKPQNVMLASGTPVQVKVLDFGIARVIGPSASTETTASAVGVIGGTVPYMSPEQVRGELLDVRSDVFSFGCVLYELLAGVNPFQAASTADIISSILTREPAPLSGRGTPEEVQRILRKCLEKDRARRYQTMADLAIDLENARGDRRAPISTSPRAVGAGIGKPQPRRVLPIAVASVVLVLCGSGIWYWVGTFQRTLPIPSARFTRITDFADSATAPALSPDGHMIAFVRSDAWFYSPGQIYVKILPDGDAVRLTDDSNPKYGPAFTPDGSRVSYTQVSGSGVSSSWDTWTVPVLGGQPTLMLRNASGLAWLDSSHVIFSEIERGTGLHMGIVTATVDRADERKLYFPQNERGMAHFSFPSPDRKWALVVEMNPSTSVNEEAFERCRLVPWDGSSNGHPVGPNGSCISAGWSPDRQWMYFSASVNGLFQLWRQRFPDGVVERLTSGAAADERGVAVAPDGRSLITAIGENQNSLWVHDSHGDREFPLEGAVSSPRMSRDGAHVYCLVREAMDANPKGIVIVDLATGRTERVLSDFSIIEFDLSNDERAVAFSAIGPNGQHQIWRADLDRRAPPRLVTTDANIVRFGAGNDLIVRRLTATESTLERIPARGGTPQRFFAAAVVDDVTVSPDGAWAVVSTSVKDLPSGIETVAMPVGGGPLTVLCPTFCTANWSPDGRDFYLANFTPASQATQAEGRIVDDIGTLVFRLPAGRALPDLPKGGLSDPASLPARADVIRIPFVDISPGSSPSTYLFLKSHGLTNLFRVPLP